MIAQRAEGKLVYIAHFGGGLVKVLRAVGITRSRNSHFVSNSAQNTCSGPVIVNSR